MWQRIEIESSYAHIRLASVCDTICLRERKGGF